MERADINGDPVDMNPSDLAKHKREEARERLGLFFGERIREARSRKGDHQANAAPLLGVSPSALHTYETGKQIPTVDFLLNLCERYNVSADYLLGLSQESISTKGQIWEVLNTLIESDVGVFGMNVAFLVPRDIVDANGGIVTREHGEIKPIIFAVFNGDELMGPLDELQSISKVIAQGSLPEEMKREIFENRKVRLGVSNNPEYDALPKSLMAGLEELLRELLETFNFRVSAPLPSFRDADDIDTTPVMTDLRQWDSEELNPQEDPDDHE